MITLGNGEHAHTVLPNSDGAYRVLFDHAPVPMWVYDRDTLQFLAVNDAAVQRYGYTRTEFLGMTFADIRVPAPNTVLENSVQRHRAKHDVLLVEGTTFDLQFNGRSAHMMVMNDITTRKQLEHEREALLKREQHTVAQLIDTVARKDETLALLDSLLATAPIGFAFLDADLRYVRINASLARINGRTVDEHLGRTVYDLFPRLAPMLQHMYDQITATGEPVLDIAMRGAPRDAPDEQRDYLISYYPVRTPDGRMLGIGTIVLDVTARTRAEHEREELVHQLKLERSRLKAVLHQIPGGLIIAAAPHGRTLLANAQAAQLFGYPFDPQHPVDQFNDAMPYRGVHADGRTYEPHEWPLARAVEHGAIVEDEEMDVVRPDGSRITVRANAAPIRDNDGRIIAGVVSFQDVSARKQAEEALKRSEERLRTLVTNASVILFALDHTGVMTLSEGKGLDVFGLAPGQLVGQSVFDLYADVPAVLDDIQRALAGAQVTGVRDVRGVTFETSYTPLHDDITHTVTGVIGVATDVTERMRVQAALRASEERLRLALEASQMGTWDWTIATGEMMWSPQFERLFGYAPGTMPRTYDACFAAVHPDDREHVRQRITDAVDNDGEYHAEFRIVWADGKECWIASDGQVVYDAARQPVRMIGVNRDITERKRAEAERVLLLEREQIARAAAEQALNIREQFLSVASHELKTPLTALMGYTSMLQKRVRQGQPLGQRESRAVAVIAQQTNRLYELVATLFDLSRIETGQLALQHQPLDLAALAQRVVNDTQTTITVRHRLHFVRPREPVLVRGDEMRLEQVLQNLLQNAIKYSPDGGIVTVRLQQHGDEACLAVSDQGIGIPQDSQGQLFQRFFRATNVSVQQIGGLGIGLYVAHEIVRRHGGTIDVQSREHEGATFTVRLPLADDDEHSDTVGG